jgi:hypothetical protein
MGPDTAEQSARFRVLKGKATHTTSDEQQKQQQVATAAAASARPRPYFHLLFIYE